MAISFKEKIKTLIKLVSKPKVLVSLLSFRHSGYLEELGWFNSFIINKPVDKNNKPLPWLTYPFIKFIINRLNPRFNLLEFGSGNSTLFFSKLVNQVVSIEHNKKWYNDIKKIIPSNVDYILSPTELAEDYIKSVQALQIAFHLILIDGIHRNLCLNTSINLLMEDGVLILDDSDRLEYKEGINNLLNNGFKSLDFWGIAPGSLLHKATTVFYRTNNCLGI